MPLDQGKLFFAMAGTGIAIGILYDVFRLLRRIFGMGRFFTALMDLVFWLCATVVASISILFFAGGELRGFLLLGMLVGGALYLAVVSPLIAALFRLLGKLLPQRLIKSIKR